jgi:hypothetical protein
LVVVNVGSQSDLAPAGASEEGMAGSSLLVVDGKEDQARKALVLRPSLSAAMRSSAARLSRADDVEVARWHGLAVPTDHAAAQPAVRRPASRRSLAVVGPLALSVWLRLAHLTGAA